MSLVFVESFDGLAAKGDYLGKWTGIDNSAGSIGAGFHGNGLWVPNENDGWYRIFPVADQDDVLIGGCRFMLPNLPTGVNWARIWTFWGDGRGTRHVEYSVGSSGQIRVARSGPTTLVTSANGLVQPGVWNYAELKAKLDDSVGYVYLNLNGVDVAHATNQDTKNGGTATVFDSFSLGNANFDDIYICNEQGAANNDFLGDCIVECLLPNGNGNSSQLVGSDGNSVDNYLLVDETVLSDADYVGSAVIGQKDTYALPALAYSGETVYGIQTYARAAKSDTGTRQGKIVTRAAGGTEADSAAFALAMGYGWFGTIVEDVPGGAGWTEADVNGLEPGVKVA